MYPDRVVDYGYDAVRAYVVMKNVSGISLWDIDSVDRHRTIFSKDKKESLFYQILKRANAELARIHSLGYTHGDVKTSNIMVSVDLKTLTLLKLAYIDFENAIALDPAKRDKNIKPGGTLDYLREDLRTLDKASLSSHPFMYTKERDFDSLARSLHEVAKKLGITITLPSIQTMLK